MSSESESAAAKDPRERLLGLKGPWDWPEDVSRFTCEEFMHAIANIDMRIEKSCKLAFHFTDVTSATYILDPASHGLRASKVGQHGGGLSMCMTPPYELAWEKHCVKTNEDAPFRRQVGEALWGEKYHEVLIGGNCASKLQVMLIVKIPQKFDCDADRLPGARHKHVLILPFDVLTPVGTDYFYPKEHVVKVYLLEAPKV